MFVGNPCQDLCIWNKRFITLHPENKQNTTKVRLMCLRHRAPVVSVAALQSPEPSQRRDVSGPCEATS